MLTATQDHSALTPLDWSVMACFLALSFAIGLWCSRRASKSAASQLRVGGVVLGWMLAGAIIATLFAEGAPIRLVNTAAGGRVGEAVWLYQLCVAVGGALLIAWLLGQTRPASRALAALMNGTSATYLAIPFAGLVMGWVSRGMAMVLSEQIPRLPRMAMMDALLASLLLCTPAGTRVKNESPVLREMTGREIVMMSERESAMSSTGRPVRVLLASGESLVIAESAVEIGAVRGVLSIFGRDLNQSKMLLLLLVATAGFASMSGVWGVLVTGFLQFWIAVGACIGLALTAVVTAGGVAGAHATINTGALGWIMLVCGTMLTAWLMPWLGNAMETASATTRQEIEYPVAEQAAA